MAEQQQPYHLGTWHGIPVTVDLDLPPRTAVLHTEDDDPREWWEEYTADQWWL